MNNDLPVSAERVRALEANLIVMLAELAEFREYMAKSPNYKGNWKDQPRFVRLRRKWRLTQSSADFIIKKRGTRKCSGC